MRCHAVIGHRTPRMILRSGLRIPNVACVSSKLTAFEGTDDTISVANLSAGGIYDVRTTFHLGKQFIIEHVLCSGMKWSIDRDNVTDLDHVFDIRVEGEAKLLLE